MVIYLIKNNAPIVIAMPIIRQKTGFFTRLAIMYITKEIIATVNA